jgi:pimeloyl-ACP methyl ester carboxylesterase
MVELSSPLIRKIVATIGVVTLVTIGLSGLPASTDPAVVLVPDFCSTASSFDDLMRHLPDRRFGAELALVSFDENGSWRAAGNPNGAVTFAMNYRAPGGPATASRIGIRDKASELKRAIDFAKTSTGSNRVVLVGHGMGGLVARAYIQGLGINPDGDVLGYDADVAGLITLDTPHRGVTTEAMAADWHAGCASTESTNWREMQETGEGSLLDALNRTPWPAAVRLDAIASYYSERGALDTDGVVLRDSQDARAISAYWAANPDVRAWTQPLASRRVDGFPQLAAHSAVARTATTAALIASLVEESDRLLSLGDVRAAVTTGLPESPHAYGDNVDLTYLYTLAGNPSSIDVMFDPRTNVEEEYDYIYVMNGSGANVAGSPFTGDQLAGRTLRISGATVRLRLTSDGSVTKFGFKLASVDVASAGVASSPLPESSHPYENNYHGGWFYTHPGDPSAINVTFDAQTRAENGYDYISVTDADGREMGDSPYTSTELAGKTIRVQGSSVRVILDTDSTGTDYGYKVTSVTPVSGATGSVSTQGASASIERTSTGVTYRTTFTLCETGGRSAIDVASIRVNLRSSTRSGGGTFTAGSNLSTTHIAAGACNTYRLNITSTNSTDFYTSVSFVITYADATGTQSSYTTPTSASITPPTNTTTPPPPTSSGSKYDGTYNFFFRIPNGPNSSSTHNLPGFLIIRNGRVTASDNSISNGTVDLQFGNIRFTSDCPMQRLTFGADWEGIMNQSAQAGSNFGQGTYQCREPFSAGVSHRSWQATQAR